MADLDRPEQDELNKIKENDRYRAAARGDAAWKEFMLGCDPAWHEHKGNIKQEDD
jgi:hypothetical protein